MKFILPIFGLREWGALEVWNSSGRDHNRVVMPCSHIIYDATVVCYIKTYQTSTNHPQCNILQQPQVQAFFSNPLQRSKATRITQNKSIDFGRNRIYIL
jgi:hypothetical protein